LLHAAEGALFEDALIEAAERVGVGCAVVDPNAVQITAALEAAGKSLGPPRQPDHKLAAAVAQFVLKA
jgi:hypothetical protein